MTVPYTYLIGWTEHRKFYYGVRYGSGCHPSDLWKTYFTSSKKVKEHRELFGEPDVIQARKVFTRSEDARSWETRVLQRMKVVKREDFLNENDKPCPGGTWQQHLDKRLVVFAKWKASGLGEKISKAKKDVPLSDEHRVSLSIAAKVRSQTENGLRLLSENGKKSLGKVHTTSWNSKIGDGLKAYHAKRKEHKVVDHLAKIDWIFYA